MSEVRENLAIETNALENLFQSFYIFFGSFPFSDRFTI